MSTTATSVAGKFVWHELMARDVAGAKAFYAGMFGWSFMHKPMGEALPDYWVIQHGGKDLGGLMAVPSPEVPPQWLGYVAVDDVDAAAKAVAAAGGKVLVPPSDIPQTGRFSLFLDAQGAGIAAYRGLNSVPDDGAMPGEGEFCWDQLTSTDVDGAAGFYRAVFGWSRQPFGGHAGPTAPGTEAMAVFHRAGGQMAASAFPAPPNVPAHWQSFVAVADLGAARTKAVELGGKVWVDCIDVPGIGAFAVLGDPDGAVVCAFEGIRE